MFKICIDPGHPSYYEGTKEVNWGAEAEGIREVELNLKLSKLLAELLAGERIEVKLTRTDNETVISNKKRPR